MILEAVLDMDAHPAAAQAHGAIFVRSGELSPTTVSRVQVRSTCRDCQTEKPP